MSKQIPSKICFLTKLVILAGFLVLFSSKELSAASYFANTFTGSDAYNGQYATFQGGLNGPKKTIKSALSVSAANDNIFIANGTYNEAVRILNTYNFIVGTNVNIKVLEINSLGKTLNFLGSNVFITDSLILKNGKIDVSSGVVFTLRATCILAGGNRNSYIDNTMYWENTVTTGANLFFPVGDKFNYRPARIKFNQSSNSVATFYASYYRIAPPQMPMPVEFKNLSAQSYWNMDQVSGPTFSALTAILSYDSLAKSDEVFQPGKLRVAQTNLAKSEWDNMGGAGTLPKFGTITSVVGTNYLGLYTLANLQEGRNSLGHRSPIAIFGMKGKCTKTPVNFFDSSFNFPGKITRYHWDFGVAALTNDTSNLRFPNFSFLTAGPFNIKLIVYNDSGKSDSLIKKLFLDISPIAQFLAPDQCEKKAVKFSDVSSNYGVALKIRRWHFGNGINRNSDSTFAYTYPNPGTFNASLYIESPNGCSDSVIKKIKISNKPKPDFAWSGYCVGQATNLKGLNQISGDTIGLWVWKSGPTLLGSTQDLSLNFATAGSYPITLIVSNQFGCFDTLTKSIAIYGNPKALFALDKTYPANDSIQCFRNHRFKFLENSFVPQSQSYSQEWFFSDSTSTIAGSPIKSFKYAGLKQVKMVVTTINGCKDSITLPYLIKDKINIDFTTILPCFPALSQFSDISTSGSATITSRKWEFGDGNSSTGTPVSHLYSNGGKYNVKLMLTNSENCNDTLIKAISVLGVPTPSITELKSLLFCPGDSGRVEINSGTNIKWLDNNDTNRRRAFYTSGKFNFRTYSGPSCFIDSFVNSTLFSVVPTYAGDDTTIVFGRFALLNAKGGTTLKWGGPNLTSDTSRSTKAKPTKNSQYTLKTTDDNGCVGFDTMTVFVRPADFVKVPNIITPNGDGKNDKWDLTEVPFANTCKILIYSEWGTLVYQLESGYNNSWDGTFKEGLLPEGTYTYIIKCPNEKDPYKGFVQIVR